MIPRQAPLKRPGSDSAFNRESDPLSNRPKQKVSRNQVGCRDSAMQGITNNKYCMAAVAQNTMAFLKRSPEIAEVCCQDPKPPRLFEVIDSVDEGVQQSPD